MPRLKVNLSKLRSSIAKNRFFPFIFVEEGEGGEEEGEQEGA